MGTRIRLGTGLLALAAVVALLGGDAAKADEKGRSSTAGAWIYEVRVVRVDPPTKEGAEAPDPFAKLTGATTKTPWRETLGLLKQRGVTTILMDQNVTALDGHKAEASADRTVPILQLNFASKSDEQRRASNVRTGCDAAFTPGDDGLQYAVSVRWTLESPRESDAPEQFVAQWSGSHPNLDGETLVLRYREQVAQGKAAARAVEIYGLVTGRFVKAP